MKGSIEMTYRQAALVSLARPSGSLLQSSPRRYPWVVVAVLLGHAVAVAGLVQLQPSQVVPVVPKPIEIRWVELTPAPKPKIEPKPEPKIEPKPVSQPKSVAEPKPATPPKSVVTAKPVAVPKPVAIPKPQPVVATPQPQPISSTKPTPVPMLQVQQPPTSTAVLSQPVAPALSTAPVAAASPVVAPVTAASSPVVAPVAAAQAVSAVSNEPRTVAIAGVSYLKSPQVEYPEQARRRGDTGTVLVRALIGDHGRVTKASIEQTSGNRSLDQAALRAVNRASFNPYRENGVVQAVYVLIPIAFNLANKD